MLGKLIKYELKSTGRIFLPFYVAIIALSIINRLFFIVLDNVDFLTIPRFITMATYVIIIIATFVMTFIVIIQRFYKNLLSDEGYLSMTLPVSASSHILSKGISACIWIVSTLLIAFISILITLPSAEFFRELFNALSKSRISFEQATGMKLFPLLLIGITFAIIAIISSILMIYTAIAFGQLSNKHKVITSFGAYFAIYTVIQIVNMIMLSIVFKSSNLFNSTSLFNFSGSVDYMYGPNSTPYTTQLFLTVIISEICIQLVFCVACFFTTRHILDKKLNLQ